MKTTNQNIHISYPTKTTTTMTKDKQKPDYLEQHNSYDGLRLL